MTEQRNRPPRSDDGSRYPADPSLSRQVEEGIRDVLIQDYLDQVFAPLVGLVPYACRQELRREMLGHLEALSDGYEELGHTPEAAVLAALRQFGDADTVGRRLATEHRQPSDKAVPIAFVCSALAAQLVIAVLLREQNALSPLMWPTGRGSLLEMGCFLLPGIAGLLAGLMAPVRRVIGYPVAAAAVALPVAALARLTATYASQTVDLATCMLELAVMQFLLWLILGGAAADFSGSPRNPSSVRQRRWTLR